MEPKKLFSWMMLFLLLFSFFTLRFSSYSIKYFKHFLGILGTLLIFGAEILYTARRKKQIKFGRPRKWLQAHIAIGIAGPVLILFHADFNFYQFSGIALFLTLLVATSGFFGRYIYRLIPRTIKGSKQSLDDIRVKQKQITEQLKEVLNKKAPDIDLSSFWREDYKSKGDFLLLFEVVLKSYIKRFSFKKRLRRTSAINRQEYRRLSSLFFQITALEKQIRLFKSAKNLLKLWKVLHVPLTIMLFMAIDIHIISIFYFGRIR